MSSPVSVAAVAWEIARDELLAVRRAVFVVEQGVPEKIEVDEHDPVSLHFLARDGEGNPVGTARLLPSGRVGRVAVLAEWRRRGVGAALMEAVIAAAEERAMAGLKLHAQVASIPFYESLGFVARGEVFEEAGIPHREMVRSMGEDGRGGESPGNP